MAVLRKISYFNISFIFILIPGVIARDPDFVAPENPCRPEDVICSVNCSVMKMSGATDCEFCFCKDPIDSLLWPDTTSTSTTTVPTTIKLPALPPGHSIVNNIHYVELQNPCKLVQAMCPETCSRGNITEVDGRVCEYCQCPDLSTRDKLTAYEASGLIGKRNTGLHEARAVTRDLWGRPCMPFFACPIFACPDGQHLGRSPNGCPICKCVQDKPSTIAVPSTTTVIPSTTTDPANFLKMFCLPNPEFCPMNCKTTNYRVGSWNCYHCVCPNGQTFVALQKPCDIHINVCSSNCTIRTLQHSTDPESTCEFCDCTTQTDSSVRAQRFIFPDEAANSPGHNTHSGNSGPKQGGNGYDMSGSVPVGPGAVWTFTNQIKESVSETTGRMPTTLTTTSSPITSPLSLCLTDANDCPVSLINCTLQTFGSGSRVCHVCLCGHVYLRNSDVVHFGHTSKAPVTSSTTTITVSQVPYTSQPKTSPNIQPLTHAPSTVPPAKPAPSTFQSVTQTPSTTLPTTPTIPTVTQTPSTILSVTQAPSTAPRVTQTSSTFPPATQVPSTIAPVTLPPATSSSTQIVAHVSSPQSLSSCFACNETNCKTNSLQACQPGQNYCLNKITQEKNGLRQFSRKCVSENECYQKWWIDTLNNPICIGMYNTDKGPKDQASECYFCCKGSSCNSAARIEDYNLYTGDDHGN